MNTSLLDEFLAAYASVAGHACPAPDIDSAARYIAGVIDKTNAKCVALAQVGPRLHAAVAAHCAARGIKLLAPPYASATLPGYLDEADIGITGMSFAIAESGTLVEVAVDDATRLVSGLPRTHIGIVDANLIVPRLFDAAGRLRTLFLENPNNLAVSFISGPSRTGDIEMILTLGVHGPEHAHAVLLTGEQDES